jgi:hypothetical protein
MFFIGMLNPIRGLFNIHVHGPELRSRPWTLKPFGLLSEIDKPEGLQCEMAAGLTGGHFLNFVRNPEGG